MIILVFYKFQTDWTEGLTGRVKYDGYGLRTEFLLDFIELNPNGLEKVGENFNSHINGVLLKMMSSIILSDLQQLNNSSWENGLGKRITYSKVIKFPIVYTKLDFLKMMSSNVLSDLQ